MHPVDASRKDNFLNSFNLLPFVFEYLSEAVGWPTAAI